MSIVKFKKNKNPRNKIVIGIASFALLLIILSITRTIFGMGYRTIRAEADVLVDRIDGTALVIKSEKVYDIKNSGSVEFLKEEGMKVAVGEDIIRVTNINEDLDQQLDIVEKQLSDLGIDYYSKEENLNLLEDIQEKINLGNYNDINEYLEDLDISKDSNLVAENLESLLIRQEELKSQIDNSNRSSSSDVSGILSYEIDGYEDVLKAQDFENYRYDSLDFSKITEKLKENTKTDEAKATNTQYKIIDDYIWYIAQKIEDERILEFEEGQVYNIQISEEGPLRARIVVVNSEETKGVILLEIRDKLHEYYDRRIIDLSLIKNETNTYKLPSRSIVEKDGKAGVYINHIYGMVRFVPVNIVGEYDDITHVSRGNNDAYITIDGEEVRTITQFDEIFLYPSNIEEDQILR